MAVWKDGNEYFHRNGFPGFLIYNVQFLSRKVDEHLLPRLMFKFHGTLFRGVFPPVMFQKLGIAVRVFGRLDILLVIVMESKTGKAPRPVDTFKVKHKLILA